MPVCNSAGVRGISQLGYGVVGLTNLDPTAMLLVTHEYAAGAAAYIGAVGIYYDNTQGEWAIFREDQAAMPAGLIFNVLVVKH